MALYLSLKRPLLLHRRLRRSQRPLKHPTTRAVELLPRALAALVVLCLDRVVRGVTTNCRLRWEQADAKSCNEER